jgi:U3 small nucleolar RNA-associated protein 10
LASKYLSLPMVSSLAAQLAKGASINTQFLVDRTKRKYAESFLFTGKEAEQYDLESIHALAVNGFAQLLALEPSFSQFQELISESSRNLDRTLLGKQENAELNGKLRLAILQLGPFLLETPTAKFLEWLVRRYR